RATRARPRRPAPRGGPRHGRRRDGGDVTAPAPQALAGLVPADHLPAVLARLAAAPGTEGLAPAWPEDVAPAGVTRWLQAPAPDAAAAAAYLTVVRGVFDATDPQQRARGAFIAHVYRAWRAVETDRQRPAYAMPANREAHDLVRAAAQHQHRPR